MKLLKDVGRVLLAIALMLCVVIIVIIVYLSYLVTRAFDSLAWHWIVSIIMSCVAICAFLLHEVYRLLRQVYRSCRRPKD